MRKINLNDHTFLKLLKNINKRTLFETKPADF